MGVRRVPEHGNEPGRPEGPSGCGGSRLMSPDRIFEAALAAARQTGLIIESSRRRTATDRPTDPQPDTGRSDLHQPSVAPVTYLGGHQMRARVPCSPTAALS